MLPQRLALTLCALALSAPAPRAAAQTAEADGDAAPFVAPEQMPYEQPSPERVPYLAPHPESADGIAIPLEVSRRALPNFLTDEVANIPHTSPDGLRRDFAETFVIGSGDGRYAAVWDPRSCRLVGVLDLAAPPPPPPATSTSAAAGEEGSEEDGVEEVDGGGEEADGSEPGSPYLLRAEGPHPLIASPGAGGTPTYFGFRFIEGRPEFLHIVGGLLVEERIWFENGGETLLQRFAVREPIGDLMLTLPAEWADRCDPSHGALQGNVLTIPKEEADSAILAYRLSPPADNDDSDSDDGANAGGGRPE